MHGVGQSGEMAAVEWCGRYELLGSPPRLDGVFLGCHVYSGAIGVVCCGRACVRSFRQVLLYADKKKIVYSHPDDAVLMSLPRRRYLLRRLEESIDDARKGREGAGSEDPGLCRGNPVGQVRRS